MALSDHAGKLNPDKVEVLGVPFKLGEFDMKTRGVWLDIIDDYGIVELQRKIQTEVVPIFSGQKADIESDPRLRSITARIEKLEKKHEGLLDKYGEEDEPEDIDEQLTKLIERQDELVAEFRTMSRDVEQEVLGHVGGAEGIIEEFMEKQDEARMKFMWTLANVKGATELSFDEWCQNANATDYEAAERFVTEGNVRWASLYGNRMQAPNKRKKKVVN